MQMIMCDLSANWNNSYRELEQRILSMEQKLDELSRSFQQTSELLSQLLHHGSLEIRLASVRYESSLRGISAGDHVPVLQVTWLQAGADGIREEEAVNPLRSELLQTPNMLNHLEDWHT